MHTFDVIRSEKGMNKFSLIGWDIPAEKLGEFLSSVLRIRPAGESGTDYARLEETNPSTVTVHMHPTFWTKTDWVFDCRKP